MKDRAVSQDLAAQLRELLRGGSAHVKFKPVVVDWPPPLRGVRPPGAFHTGWQLLEHMRICQWDILEFSRNPRHVSPEFPSGLWPAEAAPSHEVAWDRSIATFEAELRQMEDLVSDPATDLYARIPHGDGQTILREALVLADHNSYHLGQLVMLRRQLGSWKG
jgi:uncharacterized damage-inducible protein DinB